MKTVWRLVIVVALLVGLAWWASGAQLPWRGSAQGATALRSSPPIVEGAVDVDGPGESVRAALDPVPAAAVDDEDAVADDADDADEADERELLEQARPQRKVMFDLLDIEPGQCRGEYVLTSAKDVMDRDVQHLPLDGVRFEVPFAYELLHVEVLVPGFVPVGRAGPFFPLDEVKQLTMRPSGGVALEVVDERGMPLADRCVWFHLLGSVDGGYRTSSWAWTDADGRARLDDVLPGTYRVDTAKLAQWCETTLRPFEVVAGTVSTCRLVVAALDPQAFGGFTVAAAAAPFLEGARDHGVHYRFWTDSGDDFRLEFVGGAFHCVVPGEPGTTVSGRIEWRDHVRRLHPSSQCSDPITVVIGAMPPLVPVWREAK